MADLPCSLIVSCPRSFKVTLLTFCSHLEEPLPCRRVDTDATMKNTGSTSPPVRESLIGLAIRNGDHFGASRNTRTFKMAVAALGQWFDTVNTFKDRATTWPSYRYEQGAVVSSAPSLIKTATG